MFEQSVGPGNSVKKYSAPFFGLVEPLKVLFFLPPSSGSNDVSLFTGCSGLWAIFQMASPDVSPASQEPIFTRLVHLGWEQCGHGLSSRPRESCEVPVIQALLNFLGNPEAASKMLRGTLEYCTPVLDLQDVSHPGLSRVSPGRLQRLVPARSSRFICQIMTPGCPLL